MITDQLTGEETCGLRECFLEYSAIKFLHGSNGNLIQYVDKIFRLGLSKRQMDMIIFISNWILYFIMFFKS